VSLFNGRKIMQCVFSILSLLNQQDGDCSFNLEDLSLLETFFSFGIFFNGCSLDSFKSGTFLVLKTSEIKGNHLLRRHS
jgi:hypothetical protein